MSNTRLILVVFFMMAIGVHSLMSQESDNQQEYGKTSLKLAYFGEFVLHPGVVIGLDRSLYQKKWINVHWDAEIGAFFHKWNNNAYFAQSSMGLRMTAPFSGFVDINVGLGYMLTTPNGEIYVVDESGKLTREGRPVYHHIKPTVSMLFGWDASLKRGLPVLLYTGIEAYWQSHVNHAFLPHAALKLGVNYRLSNRAK